MEKRPYFIAGDMLVVSTTGALVGLSCAALFGPAWNMWLSMLIGMAIGMLIGSWVMPDSGLQATG